jgi:DNA-binding MarR family transcriptional regulator
MTAKPDPEAGWDVWQQRCKAQGLTLTVSRRAILRALLLQTEARDAVPLLQAARAYHPGTRIGTVYRFLRELEQRGWIDAHTQPHGRTRWQLRATSLSDAAQATSDIRRMVAQVRDFLRTLEPMGFAETAHPGTLPTASPSDSDRTLAVLHEIAGHLGYRLLPQRSTPA